MSHISLAGEWQLFDDKRAHVTGVTFPTDLITALHAAGHIPDPYWGINEYDVRWVAERDWTARRHFTLTSDQTRADLVVSRLDTIATIRVNGRLVAATENAFLSLIHISEPTRPY